ncbi:Shedu anti-phage system protein SduA domain-containing protein [Streptomyces sp. NPDC093610]|uniref:Shedu anti-phage system protein SduA domain-containing protein n=1 Tax=Streptomyces sp. NPDC093610 TaxID=3366048 RepID=UPI003805861E
MLTVLQAVTDENPDRPQAPTWEQYEGQLLPKWKTLLGSNPHERQMQEFLELHPCLLPGATDSIGQGGHHGPSFEAVIRQPPLQGLGPKRIPDFMWVRRDTGAIRPICIEIESPGKSWFNKDRTPTAELTQAIDQLTEWKVWFNSPENRLIFAKAYAHRYPHRPVEPQFVLIFGRNSEFKAGSSKHENPDYLRLKRDHMARRDEHFFTYDQLKPEREAGDYATITNTAYEWSLHSIPPTFSTGAHIRELSGVISDPSQAISQVDLASTERKAYILKRWKYWRSIALATESHIFSLGRE